MTFLPWPVGVFGWASVQASLNVLVQDFFYLVISRGLLTASNHDSKIKLLLGKMIGLLIVYLRNSIGFSKLSVSQLRCKFTECSASSGLLHKLHRIWVLRETR